MTIAHFQQHAIDKLDEADEAFGERHHLALFAYPAPFQEEQNFQLRIAFQALQDAAGNRQQLVRRRVQTFDGQALLL